MILTLLALGASCTKSHATDPGPGKPVYRRIQWSGLLVADVDAMVAFYRDTVGLQLIDSYTDWAWFELDDGSQFELKDGGTASASVKQADKQSALFGFQVDDLDESMALLESRGIAFFDHGSDAGEEWVYFADPEGNKMEIKQIP